MSLGAKEGNGRRLRAQGLSTAFGMTEFECWDERIACEGSVVLGVECWREEVGFSRSRLGERSHRPNGRRITLVMMDPAQPERKVILREV